MAEGGRVYEPLEVIWSSPVWEKGDSAALELIATLAKIILLSEFMREFDQLEGLKNEIARMKQAVNMERWSGHMGEMAHLAIAKKQQFISILKAVGTRNLKLYMANQECIDPILDWFGQMGG